MQFLHLFETRTYLLHVTQFTLSIAGPPQPPPRTPSFAQRSRPAIGKVLHFCQVHMPCLFLDSTIFIVYTCTHTRTFLYQANAKRSSRTKVTMDLGATRDRCCPSNWMTSSRFWIRATTPGGRWAHYKKIISQTLLSINYSFPFTLF